jgi:hypothetical protein
MQSAQPNPDKFYTLKQAASVLEVTVDVLLEWNESNILKPTITQDGKIGYTQQQIDKFIAISNLNEDINTNNIPASNEDKAVPFPLANQYTPLPSNSVDNSLRVGISDNLHTDMLPKHTTKSNKLRSFALVIAFLAISTSLIVVLAKQQGDTFLQSLDFYPTQMEDGIGKASLVQINSVDHLNPDPSLSVRADKGSFKNVDMNTSGNSFSALNAVYTESTATIGGTKHNVQKVSSVGTNPATAAGNFTSVNNYASRPNTQNTSELLGEDAPPDGNIAINLMPSTLDVKDFQDASVNSGRRDVIFIAFALGIFTLIYAYRGRASFAGTYSGTSTSVPHNYINEIKKQIVFELDQKTDGTVAVYYKGNEYKVSKPELYSETDRFIERLMSLTKDDYKKIRYDILKDEKLNLNAPLSKLVTRLGFVGVKRDLFFPRTSKNKVLFRKFITKEDLVSMGATTDEVLIELKN